MQLVDSAPSLGVYYFLSLTLSVCPSVCLFVTNFKLILLFCFSMESSHFWPQFFMNPLQNVVLRFLFRPPNAQNLLPKICKKIVYNSAYMADRPHMFAPTRGFSEWSIQWDHAKCVCPTLVAMATKFGLGAESSLLSACIHACLYVPVLYCSVRRRRVRIVT